MTSGPEPFEAAEPGLWPLLRGLRQEFSNWFVLGPLGWVALPSRCPPRGGIARLAGRRVTVKLRCGYRAECRLDEVFPFVEVFALGAYDLPTLRWSTVRTIVDVGANVGAATLWFARQSPEATIVSVEPDAAVRSVLGRNVKANRLEDRVTIVAAAVAERSGTVELGRIGPSVARTVHDVRRGGTEVVRALSLEELLEQCKLTEVDVLKLDCEGAEFDVLLTSDPSTLRRSRFMVGEYHAARRTDLNNLVDCLEAAGFATSTSGGNPIGLFHAARR